MATGATDANGIWQYGEDDSNTTFAALLNRLGSSTSTAVAGLNQTGRVYKTHYTQPANYLTSSTTYVAMPGMTKSVTRSSTANPLILEANFNYVAAGANSGYAYAVFYVDGAFVGYDAINRIENGNDYGSLTLRTIVTPTVLTSNVTVYVKQTNSGSVNFSGATLAITEVKG